MQTRPDMLTELCLAQRGFDFIAGFDEVGRGALAGPVMVGVAVMKADDIAHAKVPSGLTDSKLLSERRREGLYDELLGWCAASAVGQASNVEIDQWGISHALGIAALRALAQVERRIGMDLVGARVGAILDGPNDYITKALDSFDAPEVPVLAQIMTRIKADQCCALVSAASVIAKVTRDRLMVSLASGNVEYAPYHWERNKGYGSLEHREAIRRLGPCELHRVSWHLI
ncbi:ribonuclease HII [Bifidobacterium bombi DSM 19703]|uniref:Ribonuclease n=2 Tax=Bifidobacterium bombi TaxID=471511 RepID=A0A080N414_9BIFI|nr:ribonuclease HII [Bifidobacterium bombi DSM 19703]